MQERTTAATVTTTAEATKRKEPPLPFHTRTTRSRAGATAAASSATATTAAAVEAETQRSDDDGGKQNEKNGKEEDTDNEDYLNGTNGAKTADEVYDGTLEDVSEAIGEDPSTSVDAHNSATRNVERFNKTLREQKFGKENGFPEEYEAACAQGRADQKKLKKKKKKEEEKKKKKEELNQSNEEVVEQVRFNNRKISVRPSNDTQRFDSITRTQADRALLYTHQWNHTGTYSDKKQRDNAPVVTTGTFAFTELERVPFKNSTKLKVKERDEMHAFFLVNEFTEEDKKGFGKLLVKFGKKLMKGSEEAKMVSDPDSFYNLMYKRRDGANRAKGESQAILDVKAAEVAALAAATNAERRND